MSTYKTDQTIRNEDVAHAMNCRRPAPAFQYDVSANDRGTFGVTLKFLKLGEVQNLLSLLERNLKEWYVP